MVSGKSLSHAHQNMTQDQHGHQRMKLQLSLRFMWIKNSQNLQKTSRSDQTNNKDYSQFSGRRETVILPGLLVKTRLRNPKISKPSFRIYMPKWFMLEKCLLKIRVPV